MTAIEQNGKEATKTASRVRPLLLPGLIIAAIVAVLAFANVHLVYVAVSTQPKCVPHLKAAGSEVGAFRAARPSC